MVGKEIDEAHVGLDLHLLGGSDGDEADAGEGFLKHGEFRLADVEINAVVAEQDADADDVVRRCAVGRGCHGEW